MATLSTAQPDSSVDKFTSQGTDTEDTQQGTDYSDPDSQGEPSVMLSSAQADAAGMQDAQPGDTFTVKITVTDLSDDGFNVELEPGSAMKDQAPPMTPDMPPAKLTDKMRIKGPADFAPEGLSDSPTVLNT